MKESHFTVFRLCLNIWGSRLTPSKTSSPNSFRVAPVRTESKEGRCCYIDAGDVILFWVFLFGDMYLYIWFVCLSYIVQLYQFTYVLTPKNTHGMYIYISYVCVSVPQQFISGSHQSISYFEKYFPSWWLNQPIWKICSSKWEGVKIKNIWNHQVVPGQAKSYPSRPRPLSLHLQPKVLQEKVLSDLSHLSSWRKIGNLGGTPISANGMWTHFKLKISSGGWWFFPTHLKNMRPSNWVHLPPNLLGVKVKNHLSCHHPIHGSIQSMGPSIKSQPGMGPVGKDHGSTTVPKRWSCERYQKKALGPRLGKSRKQP